MTGRWLVSLPPTTASLSQTHTITAKSATETIELEGVLFGEVRRFMLITLLVMRIPDLATLYLVNLMNKIDNSQVIQSISRTKMPKGTQTDLNLLGVALQWTIQHGPASPVGERVGSRDGQRAPTRHDPTFSSG